MPQLLVKRPKAPEKKITTADDFELCVMRHQYFRRAKYNPTKEEMEPYLWIIKNLSKSTFSVYSNLFRNVGLQQEDIINIGRVHLVSFLGLYDLNRNKKKKGEFELKRFYLEKKETTKNDILQKNKANFTYFLKQRMQDLVRVCHQKVRNVTGQPSEDYIAFCSKAVPPKYPYLLLKDHEKLGYKKIDLPTFKSIRKKANVDSDATIFKFDDIWYVAIAVEQRMLDLNDLVGSEYNPYENFHNMSPDTILEEKENIKEDVNFKEKFDKTSNYTKRVILQKFIAENKKIPYYKNEIKTARKLLEDLGGWIR